jgi:hypothetical protein
VNSREKGEHPPYSLAIHVPAGGRHVCCVPNSEIASLFNRSITAASYAAKEEHLRFMSGQLLE